MLQKVCRLKIINTTFAEQHYHMLAKWRKKAKKGYISNNCASLRV